MAERVAQRPAQPWLTQDERGQPKAKRVANFLLLKSDGPISGLAKNGDTILGKLILAFAPDGEVASCRIE